jgi:hypothetical protein
VSDARAIEAVTETLCSVVDDGIKSVLAGAQAVTHPPHEVSTAGTGPQVNLFLYQAEVDGALRNLDPAGSQPGESGEPALPLILRYLLTPFVPNGDDIQAHRLLGGALRALHSHAMLTPADLGAVAPYSNVSQQLERVRITWQPFEERDIYSLWSAFQSPYRLSAAFEVRVVLIDSDRAATAPLPVLTRGAEDRGPVASANVESPIPHLTRADYILGQAAARVGDHVVLNGGHLTAASSILLGHPRRTAPVSITPDSVNDSSATFTLPANAAAGLCNVSAVVGTPPNVTETNEIYLAVAPKITSGMPLTVARDGAGTATVTLTCEPDALPGQLIALVFGGRPVPAAAITTASSTLTFAVANAKLGPSPVRLRVDGVDSLLVADRSVTPPQYDATQSVTVTP